MLVVVPSSAFLVFDGIRRRAAFRLDARLIAAIEAEDTRGIRDLLSRGSDPYAQEAGRNALFWAVYSDKQRAVQALLEARVDPNKPCHYGTPLVGAVWKSDLAMVKRLMRYGASPGLLSRSTTPLHEAARQGETGIVVEFLRAGAKPSATDGDGKTAGQLALDANHREIALLLSSTRDVPTPRAAVPKGTKR